MVPSHKAVMYERQQPNMPFPQKCIPVSKVCGWKIAKATSVSVEAAGYKLLYSQHGPPPLEKGNLGGQNDHPGGQNNVCGKRCVTQSREPGHLGWGGGIKDQELSESDHENGTVCACAFIN